MSIGFSQKPGDPPPSLVNQYRALEADAKKTEFADRKQLFGLLYGLVSGFAFAFFAWGVDAWLLNQAHTAFWWVKFGVGLLICLSAGGLVGWYTIYTGSHWQALLVWGGLAFLLSRVLTWLPINAAPYLLKSLDPSLKGFLQYTEPEAVFQFHLFGFIIVGLAAVICGLLEISLVDQALLSPSGAAPVLMLAVCLLLFSLAGSASDYLVNVNFREPVQVVDELIQYAADHEGEEIPPATARKLHLSAVRDIGGVLQKPRSLNLVAFDSHLGQMEILVNFDGFLVKCTTIYAQPTDCKLLPE